MAMATDNTATCPGTILTLPGEIQNKILSELEPIDLLLLRATCRHLRNIIPPLNIPELLTAESSSIGMVRDLYACRLCLRLRHSSHFADLMKSNGKRKLAGGGSGGWNRFCVECGLKPPPGQNGYCRGAYITRNGVESVLCVCCLRLGRPARDLDGRGTVYCIRCWLQTAERREMRRLEEARRRRELEKQQKRQRGRRAMDGSDSEDFDWVSDERRYATGYNALDDCGDWNDHHL